jgi:hypothetical protein
MRPVSPSESRPFPHPTHSREARGGDLTRGASLSTPQTQAEFFPCQVEFIPLLFRCYSAVTVGRVPLFDWNSCRFVRPGTRFLSRFASAWLLLESRRARIGERQDPMIFSFGNTKVCHYYFSRSEWLRMLRRMVSSEWRMGDGERTIRHSLPAEIPKRGKSPGDAVDAVADRVGSAWATLGK